MIPDVSHAASNIVRAETIDSLTIAHTLISLPSSPELDQAADGFEACMATQALAASANGFYLRV
jgi:hypothetical protein